MKKIWVLGLLLSTVSAFAAEWPAEFGIECGELGFSEPADVNTDSRVLGSVAVGKAVRLPEDSLPGMWKGEVGYRVELILQEAEILRTSEPVTAEFLCYFKRDSRITGEMICRSPLQSLPEVPGFRSVSARLPVPAGFIYSFGSISVNRSVEVQEPGWVFERIYRDVRDVACRYQF